MWYVRQYRAFLVACNLADLIALSVLAGMKFRCDLERDEKAIRCAGNGLASIAAALSVVC
jgi:hypothetical protein